MSRISLGDATPLPAGRSVPEWVGKTPDSDPPKAVKLRIFNRYAGRCGLTGAKIQVGDVYEFDHIKEIWEGGENRESNLHPVLKEPHDKKSAAARSRKSKADRVRFKHVTPTKDQPRRGPKLQGRGFGPSRNTLIERRAHADRD